MQAKKIHRAIELYSIPKELIGTDIPAGRAPRRFYPVFLDRLELPASASLTDEIQDALARSQYLIVVCSPNSAQSAWVDKEIQAFRDLGRSNRIIALIIDGDPKKKDSEACFPPSLRDIEPVAADLRKGRDGGKMAKLKLISGMLGVSVDTLHQRDTQRSVYRLRSWLALSLFILAAQGATIWYASQQRDIANINRGHAEAILNFLVYDLTTELAKIGHPEISDIVRSRIDEYYRQLGPDPDDVRMIAARATAEENTAINDLRFGNVNKALEGFRASRSIREGLARREPNDPNWLYFLAVSDAYIGNALRVQGDFDGALNFYRSSLAIMQRIKRTGDLAPIFRHQFAVAYEAIGLIYLDQNRGDDAMQSFAEAMGFVREAPVAGQGAAIDAIALVDVATVYDGIGKVWMMRHRLDLAEQSFRKVVETCSRLLNVEPTNRTWLALAAKNQDQLAHSRFEMGNVDGAVDAFQQGLEYLEQQANLDEHDDQAQENRLAMTISIANVLQETGKPNPEMYWKKANDLSRQMIRLGIPVDAVASAELSRHPD